MEIKLPRPSPSEHASIMALNKILIGNDGRNYKVTKTSSGIKKWIPLITKKDYIIKLEEILKNKNLELIKLNLTNIEPLKITEWGSCQYAGVLSMCKILIILSYYYNNPFDILNISVTLNKKNKNYLSILNADIQESDNEEIPKKPIKNISEYINIKKKYYGDLWSTCNIIFDGIYPNNTITSKHKGFRRMENNRTGVICYILYINKFVTNLNIFADFDT